MPILIITEVLEDHKWADEDITKVLTATNKIEIDFDLPDIVPGEGGALLFSKEDVIAMGKYFGLMMFESDKQL